MLFNASKCKMLHIGKNNPAHEYKINGEVVEASKTERDIGVLVSQNLKPREQCEKATRTARGVLGQVLRAFSYRDKTVLPKIYKTYIRPHLEFAVQAWAPWQQGDIEMMESVQRKMVTQVAGLKGRTYEERLEEMGMVTLEDRRNELDLIQTYKIVQGVDEVEREEWFNFIPENRVQRTRATDGGLNMLKERTSLETRRQFFSQRVIDKWNSLPLETKQAKSVQSFKNQLRGQK